MCEPAINDCKALRTTFRTSLLLSFLWCSYAFGQYDYQRYRENKTLLLLLLSDPKGTPPTVHDAVTLVSGRMMTRMAQTQAYSDALATELTKEMENGRLLRLRRLYL